MDPKYVKEHFPLLQIRFTFLILLKCNNNDLLDIQCKIYSWLSVHNVIATGMYIVIISKSTSTLLFNMIPVPELICLKYSLTSTNGYVSEMATFLADTPYINSFKLL